MLPDRVSNPGPLTYESGVLPIALRGPALVVGNNMSCYTESNWTKNEYTHCGNILFRLQESSVQIRRKRFKDFCCRLCRCT